jgi:transcriptional regulator with XRE-family HTH domain
MGIFRIKEVLKEKNITATALADRLGVSNNTITRVANDTAKPSMDLLLKMAEALDVDIRELFTPTKGGELLNGFVEYNGEIFRITSKESLEQLLSLVSED